MKDSKGNETRIDFSLLLQYIDKEKWKFPEWVYESPLSEKAKYIEEHKEEFIS